MRSDLIVIINRAIAALEAEADAFGFFACDFTADAQTVLACQEMIDVAQALREELAAAGCEAPIPSR